jgi:DNA-binding GntR family transcriptional regulator
MPDFKPPLVDQAFQRLRHDVLTGVFAAGAKLKVEELQTAYGLSSSPLREALSRLSQEGLVRADERRGFRVATLSPDDLRDITRMRLMLDVQALQEAIQHGDDHWEAVIVAAFYRLEKAESRLSMRRCWPPVPRDGSSCGVPACSTRPSATAGFQRGSASPCVANRTSTRS